MFHKDPLFIPAQPCQLAAFVFCGPYTLWAELLGLLTGPSRRGFHAALSVSGIICKLSDLESLALLAWSFLALSSVNFLKVLKDFFIFGSRKNLSKLLKTFSLMCLEIASFCQSIQALEVTWKHLSQSIHSSVLWGTLLKGLLMYQASVCWGSL